VFLKLISLFVLTSLFFGSASLEIHLFGFVYDSANIPMPNVTMVFQSNNIRRTTTTSSRGNYSIKLPCGNYSVNITEPVFLNIIEPTFQITCKLKEVQKDFYTLERLDIFPNIDVLIEDQPNKLTLLNNLTEITEKLDRLTERLEYLNRTLDEVIKKKKLAESTLFFVMLATLLIILFIIIYFRSKKRDILIDEDEEKIIQILKQTKEVTQAELVSKLKFTPSKLSRLLSNLEDKGLIKKTKKGRKNYLELL
jgi:uncharacterized membrane protein